ncbi:response regulator transcription factor [Actinoplanes sp. NPDC049681]|uniref:response regulator transcription factor n=1 Tax=Actinoplanes sp. NPDC049681 TaxID=3363905 RepID=UPI0037BC08EF
MATVLIADDDSDHRDLLSLALHRCGHDVVEAADAESARRAVAAGGIDAVLLDVRMPGLSGIELCRLLRADPHTADLPIMLVSADVNGHRILAGMDAGADDFLAKPYHRSELLARVEALLLRRERPTSRPAIASRAALLAARAAVPHRAELQAPAELRRVA